jgi:hypothetical protein
MHSSNRRNRHQAISSLLIESTAAVIGDDGHERMEMKWKKARTSGETMMMGMFASGTQKVILLQQKAKTDADRYA